MEIFTEKEAEILIKYYSEKVIGKSIGNSIPYEISYLESKSFGKDKINIFCIALYNFDLYHRKLTEHIQEFNLPTPEEVLKNIEQ